MAKLPLVEVVRATTTGASALAAALAFTRGIGKLPLPCRSRPGFLVNRILAPYMGEALELLREGVPAAVIDRAAVAFGMPVGPVELTDSVGLDVALHVARIVGPVIGRPVAPELEALVAAGHRGQKSGRGFYTWREGRPVRPTRGSSTTPTWSMPASSSGPASRRSGAARSSTRGTVVCPSWSRPWSSWPSAMARGSGRPPAGAGLPPDGLHSFGSRQGGARSGTETDVPTIC